MHHTEQTVHLLDLNDEYIELLCNNNFVRALDYAIKSGFVLRWGKAKCFRNKAWFIDLVIDNARLMRGLIRDGRDFFVEKTAVRPDLIKILKSAGVGRRYNTGFI